MLLIKSLIDKGHVVLELSDNVILASTGNVNNHENNLHRTTVQAINGVLNFYSSTTAETQGCHSQNRNN
jgi:hypothetical protein